MEQVKHTPGPWVVSAHIPDMVKDATGALIADCETTPHKLRPRPPKPKDIANARLIAAAPDLLAACQDALAVEIEAGFPDSELAGRLRAAIAKAEGR